MKYPITYLLASLALSITPAWAAPDTQTASSDARIHILDYKPNEVTRIGVQRGRVTRIMLEPDEKIEIPAVGYSSDCKSDTDEWCISAITGTNQIFVRPRDRATANNMELHTNKRDYSFYFHVVALSRGKRAEPQNSAYRVVFQYGAEKRKHATMSSAERAVVAQNLLNRIDASTARALPTAVPPNYGMTAAQQLAVEGMSIRNSNYSKQVLPKGEDADPTMVFDDGRFTYFEFPGARDIPAIFAHGSDGEETRVNWHMNGRFVVVERTARKFTIRLGNAVVGVFNESYDPTGIETPTATVSPSVVRETKGGEL